MGIGAIKHTYEANTHNLNCPFISFVMSHIRFYTCAPSLIYPDTLEMLSMQPISYPVIPMIRPSYQLAFSLH